MISFSLVRTVFLAAATLSAPATPAGLAARPLRAPSIQASAPVAQTQAPAQGVVAPASKLSGIVVDSAGKPVPRQLLTLHRVAGMSGAIDSTTTDAQGRFAFAVPAETDTSAVVFVATRWNGQLYIGSIFKPPVPAGMRDTVRVGVNPVEMGGAAGGAAMSGGASADAGMPVQPPSSSGAGRWFLAVVLALVALGAVVYALLGAARERGRERRRRLLASIAALDERAGTAGGEDAEQLRRERAELLAELTND